MVDPNAGGGRSGGLSRRLLGLRKGLAGLLRGQRLRQQNDRRKDGTNRGQTAQAFELHGICPRRLFGPEVITGHMCALSWYANWSEMRLERDRFGLNYLVSREVPRPKPKSCSIS